jgi:3-keto-5-aminohexanoate cleavage enzyme
MSTAAIITVAITGAIPRKADSPGVPITQSEQIESTHEAYEAGASVAHIHVRNPDETPSSDPELFAQVQEGIAKHCPAMIIQFSTGGRGREQNERGKMLHLKPDMASLAAGSVNFPTQIYENPPQLVEDLARAMLQYDIKPEIEVFDVAMLYNAKTMADRGLLKRPCQVQFVMGIPNALPARRKLLEFLISELNEIMPDATWSGAGIARHQLEVNRWCLELGGHLRTGLEDNIKFDKDRLARSNAELVARLASVCDEYGRHPASCAEARNLLGLPVVAKLQRASSEEHSRRGENNAAG